MEKYTVVVYTCPIILFESRLAANSFHLACFYRLAAQEAAQRDPGYASQYRRRPRLAGLSFGDWTSFGGEVRIRLKSRGWDSDIHRNPWRKMKKMEIENNENVSLKIDRICWLVRSFFKNVTWKIAHCIISSHKLIIN